MAEFVTAFHPGADANANVAALRHVNCPAWFGYGMLPTRRALFPRTPLDKRRTTARLAELRRRYGRKSPPLLVHKTTTTPPRTTTTPPRTIPNEALIRGRSAQLQKRSAHCRRDWPS
jgi:hypothetical protein